MITNPRNFAKTTVNSLNQSDSTRERELVVRSYFDVRTHPKSLRERSNRRGAQRQV